jgi:hypothetical protein
MPRRAADAINKALGGDTITRPDRGARAAYEQRIAETMSAAEPSDPEPVRETETV